MNNILLTGNMGVGKTTLLYKIIERLNISVGGFKVDRIIEQIGSTTKKQFFISSLLNGRDKYKIANTRLLNNHWDIDIFNDSFEIAAKTILQESLEHRDLIVLDEIGIMESKAYDFQRAVSDILDSNKIVIGVIKDKSGDFLNNIRSRNDVLVLRVTEDNRNTLLDEILLIIEKSYPNIIRKNYFSADPKRIKWYDNALSYKGCDYPSIFLDKISSVTSVKGKTVLDIGSGTGAFTIPLCASAKSITALDFSINMREYLETKCQNKGITNINYVLSPFEDATLDKHDITINAFASGVTKTYLSLKKLINLTNEYAFIISHHENDIYKFGADILSEKLGRSLLT
ncbi:MAG: nucleoside-triphosphatase, partial [Clostridium sp.]